MRDPNKFILGKLEEDHAISAAAEKSYEECQRCVQEQVFTDSGDS